jgi:hypothetical protein
MDAIRMRLMRNTLALILFLMDRQCWEDTRMNITAACITVAEVTEEISFIFNGKEEIAATLLSVAVRYAWSDRGLLYRLCLRA